MQQRISDKKKQIKYSSLQRSHTLLRSGASKKKIASSVSAKSRKDSPKG